MSTTTTAPGLSAAGVPPGEDARLSTDNSRPVTPKTDKALSLYHLLDPEVLADPYPLYHRLRNEDPVHWDPFLHAWVVTRYADVIHVLHHFSANRTPTPEQLSSMGLAAMNPIAQVMVRQMLFLDPPSHSRIRGLAACAFTPARVAALKNRIQQLADELLDKVASSGRMDVLADFADRWEGYAQSRSRRTKALCYKGAFKLCYY